jgi:hypothetical protein
MVIEVVRKDISKPESRRGTREEAVKVRYRADLIELIVDKS